MIKPILPNVLLQNRKPAAKLQSPKADTASLRFGASVLRDNGVKKVFDAIENGDVSTLRGFLDGPILRGELSINAKDGKGWTGLHRAVESDRQNMVEMLLASGADPNKVDYFKDSPLHFAASRGSVGTVITLLQAKASVNARNSSGYTPLHLAASNGSVDVVQVLLEKGAFSVCNKAGFTPFQVAVHYNNFDVAKQILKHAGQLPEGLKSPEEEVAYLKAKATTVEPLYKQIIAKFVDFFTAPSA